MITLQKKSGMVESSPLPGYCLRSVTTFASGWESGVLVVRVYGVVVIGQVTIHALGG